MKKKKVKDIEIGDKLLFAETGFEYVVTFMTELSILVKFNKNDLWIPKSMISIFDSLLSTSGYRLFKLKSFDAWFVAKNNIQ